jgi:hypothetical protein
MFACYNQILAMHFAQTPIINYISAGLWIAAPAVISLLILGLLIRSSRLGTIIAGALLIVGSVPAAIMSNLSINGCCGAPSTGFEGIGYVIGIVIAAAGFSLIIYGKKFVKKKPARL